MESGSLPRSSEVLHDLPTTTLVQTNDCNHAIDTYM